MPKFFYPLILAKVLCESSQLSKNGYRRGKQCYLCKECGKQFVDK
ncbi:MULTISPECIES: IS1/IS1595 family N-terminal zinc-binding domain-containing protein [Calothrix]